MNDPAKFDPQNIDRFARELAVALRRILGIADDTDPGLPIVTYEESTQISNQETTHG